MAVGILSSDGFLLAEAPEKLSIHLNILALICRFVLPEGRR